MKKTLLISMVLVFLFVGCGSKNKEPAQKKDQVKVTRVIDGDTIDVEYKSGQIERIRLIGIDSPELHHPNKQVEEFAQEAYEYTKKHLEGKKIRLEFDQISSGQDKYGRTLAYVWNKNKLFNEQIIRDGYAHAYLHFPFKQEYMEKFRTAEQEARNKKRGLWKPKK